MGTGTEPKAWVLLKRLIYRNTEGELMSTQTVHVDTNRPTNSFN